VRYLFEREFYNPDGTLDRIEQEEQTGTAGGSVTYSIEGFGQECGKVLFGAAVGALVHGGGGVAPGYFDICKGGSVALGVDPDLDHPTITKFMTSAGTITFKPTCFECDGSFLQTDDGPFASICASDLFYYIEIWNGEDWIPETGTLTKGDCQWNGGTVLGNMAINITTIAPGCPDDCECNDCDCSVGGSDGVGCGTNWQLSVTPLGQPAWTMALGEGSCPPEGFKGGDGVYFRNLILSFDTKCK
jgi:hypothetical protein